MQTPPLGPAFQPPPVPTFTPPARPQLGPAFTPPVRPALGPAFQPQAVTPGAFAGGTPNPFQGQPGMQAGPWAAAAQATQQAFVMAAQQAGQAFAQAARQGGAGPQAAGGASGQNNAAYWQQSAAFVQQKNDRERAAAERTERERDARMRANAKGEGQDGKTTGQRLGEMAQAAAEAFRDNARRVGSGDPSVLADAGQAGVKRLLESLGKRLGGEQAGKMAGGTGDALIGGMRQLHEGMMQMAARLAPYSGELSQAQAHREMMQVLGDIRRAGMAGNELAKLSESTSRLEQAGQDAMAAAMKDLVPFVKTGVDGLVGILNIISAVGLWGGAGGLGGLFGGGGNKKDNEDDALKARLETAAQIMGAFAGLRFGGGPFMHPGAAPLDAGRNPLG